MAYCGGNHRCWFPTSFCSAHREAKAKAGAFPSWNPDYFGVGHIVGLKIV